jgi:hypothetical protein
MVDMYNFTNPVCSICIDSIQRIWQDSVQYTISNRAYPPKHTKNAPSRNQLYTTTFDKRSPKRRRYANLTLSPSLDILGAHAGGKHVDHALYAPRALAGVDGDFDFGHERLH